jgi:hypothetical protein
MSDERFDYARKQMSDAAENAAQHITWVICRETGKHTGNDTSSVYNRERLTMALESFLSA